MADDVADVMRFESGARLTIHAQPVELSGLGPVVLGEVRRRALVKPGVECHFSLAAVSKSIESDAANLLRVLSHLMRNACAAAEEGDSVVLSITETLEERDVGSLTGV